MGVLHVHVHTSVDKGIDKVKHWSRLLHPCDQIVCVVEQWYAGRINGQVQEMSAPDGQVVNELSGLLQPDALLRVARDQHFGQS
mmetsp:Transcript_88842/g.253991  ORF Transcript_88842/g.253991 Transcript_88842/m.253991 type:complete len:84 (-) Transcript_88842:108-359(-)